MDSISEAFAPVCACNLFKACCVSDTFCSSTPTEKAAAAPDKASASTFADSVRSSTADSLFSALSPISSRASSSRFRNKSFPNIFCKFSARCPAVLIRSVHSASVSLLLSHSSPSSSKRCLLFLALSLLSSPNFLEDLVALANASEADSAFSSSCFSAVFPCKISCTPSDRNETCTTSSRITFGIRYHLRPIFRRISASACCLARASFLASCCKSSAAFAS